MNRLLACSLGILTACTLLARAEEKVVKTKVAVYDLEGVVSESGRSAPSLFSMDPKRPLTLLDLTRSLGKAAADVVAGGVGTALHDAQMARRKRIAVSVVVRRRVQVRGDIEPIT